MIFLTRRRASLTRGPGAFTLVELLVVTAVITVLAALLLVAFGRALERAQAVRCSSNLRQGYFAFRMYADSNSGFLPPRMTITTIDWLP